MTLPGILRRLLEHINTKAAHDSVVTGRKILTAAPLTGGGDLSADRTLGIDAATESAAGAVRLSTVTEAIAGLKSTMAVHPLGLKAAIDAALNAFQGTSTYTIFDVSGTFTAPGRGTAFVTVVGGGQTGDKVKFQSNMGTTDNPAAGGGAGQITEARMQMKKDEQAAVIVGAGGGVGKLAKGSPSSFGNIVAAGGDLPMSVPVYDVEGRLTGYTYPKCNGERTLYGLSGARVKTDGYYGGGQAGYYYPMLSLGRDVQAGHGTGYGGYGFGAGGGAGSGNLDYPVEPGRGFQGVVTVLFVRHRN